jgi:acyl dehydratase
MTPPYEGGDEPGVDHDEPVTIELDDPPTSGRTRLTDLAGIQALIGIPLGRSTGYTFFQSKVNQFADLTGDHQAIHTDPEFAKTLGLPGTIVHGLYLSAIVPPEIETLLDFTGMAMVRNLGHTVQYRDMVPTYETVYIDPVISAVEERMGGIVIIIDYAGYYVVDGNDVRVIKGQEQYLATLQAA